MNPFIKNYFTFSKGDRNAFFILLCLLVIVIFLPSVYGVFFYKEKVFDHTSFREEILAFELSQINEDKKINHKKSKTNKAFNYHNIDRSVKESQLNPFMFNPNNLPTEQWQKLGLTDRQIRSIKNFEAKGGRFFVKEDFKKMFVISDDEYEILEPYIELPDKRTRKPSIPKATQEVMLIEINNADTTELKSIRGIGSRLSTRIVNYRESLGGFYQKDQLLEVFGIDTALYKTIAPYISIDRNLIRQEDINSADIQDLAKHPYISRNVAMSLVNIRNMHGTYASLADIMKSALIDDELFYKISPYLIINQDFKD